ncbi:MAG: hypothetical protein Q3971_01725 [Moraxella sp.]|nr:hypothetical protein [Moraxella sp.]
MIKSLNTGQSSPNKATQWSKTTKIQMSLSQPQELPLLVIINQTDELPLKARN